MEIRNRYAKLGLVGLRTVDNFHQLSAVQHISIITRLEKSEPASNQNQPIRLLYYQSCILQVFHWVLFRVITCGPGQHFRPCNLKSKRWTGRCPPNNFQQNLREWMTDVEKTVSPICS